MMHYDRIETSQGTCHYWYFSEETFKSQCLFAMFIMIC